MRTDRFHVGDSVFALLPIKAGDGYAEYAVVGEQMAAPAPSGITLSEARPCHWRRSRRYNRFEIKRAYRTIAVLLLDCYGRCRAQWIFTPRPNTPTWWCVSSGFCPEQPSLNSDPQLMDFWCLVEIDKHFLTWRRKTAKNPEKCWFEVLNRQYPFYLCRRNYNKTILRDDNLTRDCRVIYISA